MRLEGSYKNQSEQGAILVLTALLLVVLVGMAALAVDAANAWSTKRLAQNNADMATLSALSTIPYTFLNHTGGPNISMGVQLPGSVVADEVLRISDINGCGAECALTSTVTIDPVISEFRLQVDVGAPSSHAFAQAIGGGSVIDVDATATATITVHDSSLDVLPLGFSTNPGTSRYRCVPATDPPPPTTPCVQRLGSTDPSDPPAFLLNNTDVTVIGMRRIDTTPECADAAETTINNFKMGADHLIDTVNTPNPASPLRDERDACDHARVDGHTLTMPNTSKVVDAGRLSHKVLQDGLSGPDGRLAGNETELWNLLEPGLGGLCELTAILNPPWLPPPPIDPEELLMFRSEAMAQCLNSWGGDVIFQGGISANERLGWGVPIATGGSGVTYRENTGGARRLGVPVWIHTVLWDTGADIKHTLGNAPDQVGFTLYVLDERMFPDDVEHGPGGLENLDYQLVD